MNDSRQSLTDWPIGNTIYHLRRYHADPTGTLRAWDTADEYLLNAVAADSDSFIRCLIVNDEFGALTTALADRVDRQRASIQVVQDTSAGREAITQNVEHNYGTTTAWLSVCEHLDTVDTRSAMDLVLVKLPKDLGVLEEQLRLLRQGMLTQSTRVYLAGMVKHLSPNVQPTLEKMLGPTQRHLAVRKARLFTTTYTTEVNNIRSRRYSLQTIADHSVKIQTAAGVFASDQPDPATRFLCRHLPALKDIHTLVDLGCGSGTLGLVAAQRYPLAHLVFVDTSTAAIRLARHNKALNQVSNRATFLCVHRLQPWQFEMADLILCNPPFHQQHTQTLGIAQTMFADAHAILHPGGRMVVVANRHLPYYADLRKRFRKVGVLAQNSRFKIYQALK